MRLPNVSEVLSRIENYKRLRVDTLLEYDVANTRAAIYESMVLSAIDSMTTFIVEHKDIPPTESMALFINECERCSLKDTSTNHIFSIYTDVGKDVLDFVGFGEEWWWHVCC